MSEDKEDQAKEEHVPEGEVIYRAIRGDGDHALFSPEVRDAFARIGHEALNPGFAANLVRGIYAGFLIATMVWLLPGSGESRMWIVIILAWVVGIASLAHVVAGASETLYVVFRGERSFVDCVVNFLLPAFVGNSIGGVALVAALSHAQHAPAESG